MNEIQYKKLREIDLSAEIPVTSVQLVTEEKFNKELADVKTEMRQSYQQPIYCDNDSNSWKYKCVFYNSISSISSTYEEAEFSPTLLTTFNEGAELIADGKYKIFATNANSMGIYGSSDGIVWEKINLPTVGDIDLNNTALAIISYINGRYVIVTSSGQYFNTTNLSNDASTWKRYDDLAANYHTISTTNPILKISDNEFAIFGSTSCKGLGLIRNWNNINYISGKEKVFNGITINHMCKVSDSIFVAGTNMGTYISKNGIDGDWSLQQITTDSSATSWQDINVYYDEDLDMTFICGDGGDDRSEGRHTDIWYSSDKCQTWKHAKITGIDTRTNRPAIGKIVKYKDRFGNKQLVAIGNINKGKEVVLLTSYDGVNWNAETDIKYERKHTSRYIFNAEVAVLNDVKQILFNDYDSGADAKQLKSYYIAKKLIPELIFPTSEFESSFQNQLLSSSSKEVILDFAKTVKLSSLYSDDNNKTYKISEEEINKIHTSYLDGFKPAFITTLNYSNVKAENGKIQYFAPNYNNTGIYRLNDNIWEKIQLPTIDGVDLNEQIFSVLEYINKKYVLVTSAGILYFTSELCDNAEKWHNKGIELKNINNVSYNAIEQCNPILRIDHNRFIIYHSNEANNCYMITDFQDATEIVINNNRIYSIDKIDTNMYIAATNSGVQYCKDGIMNTWQKANIGHKETKLWSWLNVFYDNEHNITFASGDGGDYTDSDPTRKIDIWYSLDKCESWQHANFVDRPANELRAVGKIIKCKTTFNNVFVALATGNKISKALGKEVYIYTSNDGIDWKVNESCIYIRSTETQYIFNAIKLDDINSIVYFDHENLFKYKLNDIQPIATTNDIDDKIKNCCITVNTNEIYISILGDEFSAYQGTVPTRYQSTYPKGNVDSIDKMWWKQVIDKTKMKLLVNSSSVGSMVTGDTSEDAGTCVAANNRIKSLSVNGISPNIIICFVGINDFKDMQNNIIVGNYDGETAIPAEGEKKDFSEAYAIMLNKLLKTYPRAQIFCCSIMQNPNDAEEQGYPYINPNNIPMIQFNKKIEQLAKAFGCHFIDIYSCGINFYNRNETMLLPEIEDVQSLHLPSEYGMNVISDYIRKQILTQYAEYPLNDDPIKIKTNTIVSYTKGSELPQKIVTKYGKLLRHDIL